MATETGEANKVTVLGDRDCLLVPGRMPGWAMRTIVWPDKRRYPVLWLCQACSSTVGT